MKLYPCLSLHNPLFPKLRDVSRIVTELSQYLFAIVCHHKSGPYFIAAPRQYAEKATVGACSLASSSRCM
jgi:hypothetical protein